MTYVGLYCGLVGEKAAGLVGLYLGLVGLQVGLVGLYTGLVGLVWLGLIGLVLLLPPPKTGDVGE